MKADTLPVTGSVHSGTTDIVFTIVYQIRRRSITIEVHPDKSVTVRAPLRASEARIRDLVEQKAPWIEKKIAWFDRIRQFTAPKEYVTGEIFLFLGRQYRLAMHNGDDSPRVTLQEGNIDVSVPQGADNRHCRQIVKTALLEWYRAKTFEQIGEMVGWYALRLDIPAPPFKVKQMNRRWGSCGYRNCLNFNMALIMAPIGQIEYVVAHELCHIRHKNHSSRFWSHLKELMPDYEIRREALRDDGWKYML
jgi:hypothetical protein